MSPRGDLVTRVLGRLGLGAERVDADTLAERVTAVRRFLRAADGHLPEPMLVTARTVVDRAGERLELSREHTVVALAGATGSGKSSIFNALAGMPLSQVGVRRPTTGIAHACVWGSDGAGPLLDWLGVPPNRRFDRESALDGEELAALRGLVLLDLPDFDSVEESHRTEVDRLLRLVDLVVWVLDPQKYADELVHERYLRRYARHRDVTVVALNQADLLAPPDIQRCLADLTRLLDADGLGGVPVLGTSTVRPGGLEELRGSLQRSVAEHEAYLRRLAADVNGAVDELLPLVAADAGEDRVDRGSVGHLIDTLTVVAGVPAVVEAVERAYRHRATASLGWPLARWVRRLRPDPLRRLHLDDRAGRREIGDGTGVELPVAATSLPEATAAQRAAADLPEPWPAAVLAAARGRQHDVPDAMDVAVARTDLGVSGRPLWWRVTGLLQWLATAAALAGLAWLALRYAFIVLGLPELPGPHVGALPLATVLLLGGLLFGLLLSALVSPLAGVAARRARRRAERRLRSAVAEVASDLVVSPVRGVLRAYADARAALTGALTGTR